MRPQRFQTWITDLVDAALPPDVERIDWAETGVTKDLGEQTLGLVFRTSSGAIAFMQIVHGGGPRGEDSSKPEEIIEGEPPQMVESVTLALDDRKRLRMSLLEEWFAALVVNSGSREVASVERYSTRENLTGHPYGLTIRWHDGAGAFLHLLHTLAPGEQRTANNRYQPKEAV